MKPNGLVIRHARPNDYQQAADVLVDAYRSTAVAVWADPDPRNRIPRLDSLFLHLLTPAGTAGGAVRIATISGRVLGVAVSYAHPAPAHTTGMDESPEAGPAAQPGSDTRACTAQAHLRRLSRVLQEHHPHAPHHHVT